MTSRDEALAERIAARRRTLLDSLSEYRLSIAVLGPSLENSEDVGTQKRYQIADTLARDGHDPFFPEERLDNSDPTPWIEQERQLLSDSTVHLVIVLDAENSAGVLIEMGNFVSVPEIHSKTAILFPREHYRSGQNLPGNTLQAYRTKMLYTSEQMVSCELVGECRNWAYARQNEIWSDMRSERF